MGSKKGITLLLVILIMSALFSISVGIFNIVFGQILISGEIADSFLAVYAADQAVERTLYKDRQQGAVPDGYTETRSLSSGSCYTVRVDKSGGLTQVVSVGQYRCDGSARVVKRSFLVTY